jgi:hypothetical protein
MFLRRLKKDESSEPADSSPEQESEPVESVREDGEEEEENEIRTDNNNDYSATIRHHQNHSPFKKYLLAINPALLAFCAWLIFIFGGSMCRLVAFYSSSDDYSILRTQVHEFGADSYYIWLSNEYDVCNFC